MTIEAMFGLLFMAVCLNAPIMLWCVKLISDDLNEIIERLEKIDE